MELEGVEAVDPRAFTALLTGLTKGALYGDSIHTHTFLVDQLFVDSEIPADTLGALFDFCERVLRRAASEDWSAVRLEAFLRQNDVLKEEALVAAFVNFWRNERAKLHDHMYKKSCCNDSLLRLSWRVDVKTKARHVKELNDPVALLEMTKGTGDGKQSVLQLELSRAKAMEILATLNDVQDVIASRT